MLIFRFRTQLKLSTISAARSAFCLFTFEPGFFSKYRITAKPRRRGEPSAIQLQILGKTLHDIFKQKAVSSAQRINLSIPASDFSRAEDLANNDNHNSDDDESNNVTSGPSECRLTITIFCPHGVKKTYKLTYQAAACMVALANKEDCSSSVTASPRIIKDWTDHFMLGRHGTDEITFWYTTGECRVKSYEGMNSGNAPAGAETGGNRRNKSKEDTLSRQSISTTLNVHTDEFDTYEMGSEEALITVTLKEFKAIIEFAMAISNSVEMHFLRGGEPLLASLETDSLSIQFVLSTNADDPAGIQRESTTTAKQEDVKPRLSQAKLGSMAPSQQASRQNSRANSTVLVNRGGTAGASNMRNGSATTGPPINKKNSRPLFRPRDEDDDDDGEPSLHIGRGTSNAKLSNINAGSTSRAAPISIEDEEEENLWNQADNENPSFSQQAIELDLDNSVSQISRGGGGHQLPAVEEDEGGESRLEMDEMQERPQSTQVSRGMRERIDRKEQRPEVIDMSLDEEDDSEMLIQEAEEEESSRTRKGRKAWDLGLTR